MKRPITAVGVLLLGVVLVYAQTLSFEFVQFDDNEYVYANELVLGGVNPARISRALLESRAANWHPLTWISHMTDVELFGVLPRGHHAMNVVLHGANVILLLALFLSLTSDTWRSTLAAGLFAVHPLNVESVAWISQRKNVLSMAFFLFALLAWVAWRRRSQRRWYFAALALSACALMAKPTAIVFPLSLLAVDFWPLRRPWSVRDKLPFFGLAAVVAGITFGAQSSWKAVSGIGFGARIQNAFVSLMWYPAKGIWPSGLHAYYPHAAATGGSIPLGAVIFSAGAILALTAAAWLFRHRHPHLLFGWSWYVACALPTIGLIQAGEQAHADRYAYLPLIGLFVAAAWLVPAWHWIRYAGFSILIVFGAIAARQVTTWSDSETLFARSVQVDPNNWFAWTGLGVAQIDHGRFSVARSSLERAIALNPQFPVAHYNAGFLRVREERYREALPFLREAVRLDPGYTEAWVQLGVALQSDGAAEEGAIAFEKALELNPIHGLALYGAALTHRQVGSVLRATEYEMRLRKASPDLAADYEARVLRGEGIRE